MRTEQEFEPFMPPSFIAGRVVAVKGNERETVFNTARALFDTEQLRFVMTIDDGFAWYLAAPSRDFGNNIKTACPLSAALPGSPNHQGNGAYLHPISPTLSAVAVKSDDGITAYVGEAGMVKRFIEKQGADKVFEVNQRGEKWMGFLELERKEGIALAKVSIIAGIACVAFFTFAWGAAISFGATKQATMQSEVERRTQATQNVSNELNAMTSRVDVVMAEHQRIARVVNRVDQALIKWFRNDGGKITWMVEMPAGTSPEILSSLGAGTQITTDPTSGKLTIRKD